MHPRKRLSIKSAIVAGIAASVLLGLAGATSARAVVYCQYVVIRTVALLGPASCFTLVRWRTLRSGTMPAAI
jgi:hypothetical protein